MKSPSLFSNDNEILIGLKAGETAALDKLYEQHSGFLLGYLLKKGITSGDAGDLIQDMFFQLWSKREQLTLRKDFRAYLTWKLRNRLIDQYHHRLVEQAYRQEALAQEAFTTDIEDRYNFRELQLALDSGIAAMV